MVKVLNATGRSATVAPSSLILVDQASGKQYEVQQTLDYQGLISTEIAHNAHKTSILVYPKLDDSVTTVSVYADTNPGQVGTPNIK